MTSNPLKTFRIDPFSQEYSSILPSSTSTG